MRTLQSSLTTLFFFLSMSMGFSQAITWQMHAGQGLGKFIPGPDDPSVREILTQLYGRNAPQHGDPGGYAYAEIPPTGDAGWTDAPTDPEDGQLCFRLDRSEVVGVMTQLDFTYFQTFVTISDPEKPFLINFEQVDDGVRAYVFNAQYPNGTFLMDGSGETRLYQAPLSADLSSLLVRGTNRIVLVQFDNASTQNYLKVVVPEEEACADDSEAPQIFNELEGGTLLSFSDYLKDSYDCGEKPVINPVVLDNCDLNPELEVDSMSFPDGSILLIFTARDASGRETSEFHSYTLSEDEEAPEVFVVLEDSTQLVFSEYIQEVYECVEPPSLNLVAEDDCDPNPVLEFGLVSQINPDSSETFRLNISAVDASGNQTEAEYFYTVFYDIEAPQVFVILEDSTKVLLSEHIRENYECGESPSMNLVAEDNCDPEPELEFEVIITFDPETFEEIQGLRVQTSDASGNATEEFYRFTTSEDTEAPLIEGCPDSLSVSLDLCNQYELTLEDLGISVSDNCTDSVIVELGQTMFEGAGTTTVKLTATDEVGLESSCEIVLVTETNPDFLTVTAEDDAFFTVQGKSITFSSAQLLANDSTTNGSVPVIQDLAFDDPDIGTLIDNEDGTFTFEPAIEFFGEVQIPYSAVVEYEALDSTEAECVPDFSEGALIVIKVEELPCDLFVTGVDGSAATCPGEATGTITIRTDGSDNELEYSIDRTNFQLSNVFEEVFPGRYRISVREVDNKACVATASVTIREQQDTEAPQINLVTGGPLDFQFITLEEDLPLDTVDCNASSLEPWVSANVEDNCDPDATLSIRADSTLTENGDLLVTYTLTGMDVSGNVNVKTASVVRLKVELECPADTITAMLDSNGVFIPDVANLGIDTACFGERISIEPAEITTVGMSEITVTATDLNGNVSTCVIPVNVEDNNRPFITTWETTAEDPEVIIYTNADYTYEYTIDWGDGSDPELYTGQASHTYMDHSAPHTVSISGEFPHFLASDVDRTVPIDPLVFSTHENAEQLRSVESWGEIQWKDFSYAFTFTHEFSINATDVPDLSQVSSMRAAFLSANLFNSDITAWQVGTVTDMHAMFLGAAAFNQDIGSWNVSNVTDMRLMFSGATAFNQDISSWNVGNVIDMNFMFSNTGNFNQNIGAWNVANVMDMNGVFLVSSSFNGAIGSWEVGNVTTMENIFFLASSFNQDIGNWDLGSLVSNANSAKEMLSLSGMSVENYDATLNGWAAQAASFPADLEIGALNLSYSCAGQPGRDALMTSNNWTFIGDALNEACPTGGIVERPTATVKAPATAILIFPNPATDVVNIQLNDERLRRVEIRDGLGRMLWSRAIEDGQAQIQFHLDRGIFPAGLYTVSVFSEESMLLTKRLFVID